MTAFASIPGYATTRRTVVQGTGAEVAKGDKVTVHAKGTVKETNKVFWSTKDPGQKPFTYDAGVGAVITGTPRDDATMRRRASVFTRSFVRRRDASTDDESIVPQGGTKAASAPRWARSSNSTFPRTKGTVPVDFRRGGFLRTARCCLRSKCSVSRVNKRRGSRALELEE